jgi:hypothetical protein
MWALDAKEMGSSSKIDLKNVLLWMSIKDVCKLEVPIIVRLLKEGCISLVTRRRFSCVTHKHD